MRRLYNIQAYHHVGPPMTTPLYKLVYDSNALIKDLEAQAKAREEAQKKADAIAQRNAMIRRQNVRRIKRRS